MLYLPDYVPPSTRISQSVDVARNLQKLLRGYTIEMKTATGPFEDDLGVATFFDKSTRHTPEQIALDTKRDLYTSMATVLRAIAAYRPDPIVGEGQGATVALCISSPFMVEVACGHGT